MNALGAVKKAVASSLALLTLSACVPTLIPPAENIDFVPERAPGARALYFDDEAPPFPRLEPNTPPASSPDSAMRLGRHLYAEVPFEGVDLWRLDTVDQRIDTIPIGRLVVDGLLETSVVVDTVTLIMRRARADYTVNLADASPTTVTTTQLASSVNLYQYVEHVAELQVTGAAIGYYVDCADENRYLRRWEAAELEFPECRYE